MSEHLGCTGTPTWRPTTRRAGADGRDTSAPSSGGSGRACRRRQQRRRRGGGGAQWGLMDKASAVQGNLRRLFEGWELVAAFALALMLVNGIALSHASGPGVTLFQGAGAPRR